jgi:hypothetical protein
MGFTKITLQMQMVNADGTAASGTVYITPTRTLTNGIVGSDTFIASANAVAGAFDGAGRLVGVDGEAMTMNATDDSETLPIGSVYIFTIRIDGQGVVEFRSPLWSSYTSLDLPIPLTCCEETPTMEEGSPVVQLASLVACAGMVGLEITDDLITGSVIDFDSVANTITLDANATGTGTGERLVFETPLMNLWALKMVAGL